MQSGAAFFLSLALIGAASGVAAAADLGSTQGQAPDGLPHTRPVGIASEWPHSPAADIVTTDVTRFAVWSAAKARCPRSAVVWVTDADRRSRPVRRDHAPGPQPGVFMCEADAVGQGDYPAR